MKITLYDPSQAAQMPVLETLPLAGPPTGSLSRLRPAAELLDCAPKLVDVLAEGPGYTVFTVFDHEGPINMVAMRVVADLTGVAFSPDDDDEVLRGPVLVVLRD